MAELKLRELTPGGLAQQWTEKPLEGLSWCGVVVDDQRSILGEILASAFDPNAWLKTLDEDTAIALVSKVLGLSTLHTDLIDQVVSDHIINQKHRAETVNDVARNVLVNPGQYLGENTPLIMAFGRQIDVHAPSQWRVIHERGPVSFWDFESERKRANRGYKQPDYNFGYHTGQHVAKLALIQAGIVSRAPFSVESCGGSSSMQGPPKVALRNVDEMLGLAINEIQSFGSARSNQRLYFLPKFYNDEGRPLNLSWLRSHAD